MSRKVFRVCVVGCGWVGAIHAQGYRRLGKRVEYYFCDSQPERAQRFMRQFGGIACFSDYANVLDSQDIDGIDICLPHYLHCEAVINALRAGKEVCVEKPMAMSCVEAQLQLDAAQTAGKTLMVAENIRYWPHVRRAAELLRQQVIGKIALMQINCMLSYPIQSWRQTREHSGGGVVIDLGHHFVDLAVCLGGAVESVYASFPSTTDLASDNEHTAILHLRHQNQTEAQLNLSYRAPHAPNLPVFIVYGERGTLYLDSKGLFLATQKRPTRILRRRGGTIPDKDWFQSIHAAVEDFADAFLTSRKPQMTGLEGYLDMKIIEAAAISHKTGKRVTIDATIPADRQTISGFKRKAHQERSPQ